MVYYSTTGGTAYDGEVYSTLHKRGSEPVKTETHVIKYCVIESPNKETADFYIDVDFISSWAYLKSFRRHLCCRAEWLKSRQPRKSLSKCFYRKKFMKGKRSRSHVWAGSFGASGLRYRVNKNRKGR